ncbi:SAM-dependent methyltransferase [Kitasatospora sp. NPDC059795]|uniref:SAM-dependent methyltransferase n=1 Tax=Kitasatospora sp. NPDC059795 TaxID=3346949 RepID=UPI00365B5D06
MYDHLPREQTDSPWDTIDVSRPTAARMYDHLLGGRFNHPSDREAVAALLEIAPSTRELALNNRAFLIRVVETIARDFGIRQFIDHGSGLPTQDNVHQVAQRVHPDCRVVYIDNDPHVHAYGRLLLDENPQVALIKADMTDTEGIFEHRRFRDLINLSEPAAALFVSVTHCLTDQQDPFGMIQRTVAALPAGSVVVVCQLVSDDEAVRNAVTQLMYNGTGGHWGRVRTEAEVRAYFDIDRLRIEEPGLMDVTYWRPDRDVFPRQRTLEWVEFGGVARVG